MFSCRAAVQGVRTTAIPSPGGSLCNMRSFVTSTDGRRHSPTLLHLPAIYTYYASHDNDILEQGARNLSFQLRALPNVEQLGLFCSRIEIAQFLEVLSDWPKLRQIDTSFFFMKCFATCEHLDLRLQAINTLCMDWDWRPEFGQGGLYYWSETLRDLTLIVGFVQRVNRQ